MRGLGAMLAVGLRATGSRLPSSPPPSPRRRAQGLLLLKAGIYGHCIRVLLPLVIEDAELAEALDVWEEALTEALGYSAGPPAAGTLWRCTSES